MGNSYDIRGMEDVVRAFKQRHKLKTLILHPHESILHSGDIMQYWFMGTIEKSVKGVVLSHMIHEDVYSYQTGLTPIFLNNKLYFVVHKITEDEWLSEIERLKNLSIKYGNVYNHTGSEQDRIKLNTFLTKYELASLAFKYI